MEKISLDGKTNFFEQRVSEYSHVGKNGFQFDVLNLDDKDF